MQERYSARNRLAQSDIPVLLVADSSHDRIAAIDPVTGAIVDFSLVGLAPLTAFVPELADAFSGN